MRYDASDQALFEGQPPLPAGSPVERRLSQTFGRQLRRWIDGADPFLATIFSSCCALSRETVEIEIILAGSTGRQQHRVNLSRYFISLAALMGFLQQAIDPRDQLQQLLWITFFRSLFT